MKDDDQIKVEPPVKVEPQVKVEPPFKAEPVVKVDPPVKAEPQVKAAEPPVKADSVVKVEPPVKAGPLDVVVDRWFSDQFHGSVVARDVETYNYVYSAVEDLKKRLKGDAS